MMIGEESGDVILAIFQRDCKKPGDSLTNKLLHDAYFRKTDSGLGFTEGLKYLVEKRWLAATVGVVNCHEITKSGRRREV